ncbi:cupin domain-containing protein [Haloparvum sp. AD34]
MRKVVIDDVDPAPDDTDRSRERRDLTDPLGAANVAVSRYVLDPGERFSGSLHAHADQEEVFLVVEGTTTFETTAGDDANDEPRDVTVSAGEAIRFAPGEFQTGHNEGDEPVVAFALGAPRDSEDVRISRIPVLDDRDISCPDCGRGDMRIARGGDGDEDDPDADFVCPDCSETLALD